jgi:hypothetical protein
VLRDSVAMKRISCIEEIQLGRHMINPVEALSSVGKKGDFYYFQTSGVLKIKELSVVGLIDHRSILSQRKEATSLILRKHLINLVEVVTEGGFLKDEGHELDAEEASDKARRGGDRERISENL